MRPRSLDEVVGQGHLVGPGGPLRALIEADRLSSSILWGPPGSGKTTLAAVMAASTAKAFVALSAVTAGVREVRAVIEEARTLLGEHGTGTIVFIDEVHRFNKAQQDTLLPAVESGLITLVGATTENPFFEVNAPLLSRSTLWRLLSLGDDDITILIRRALDAEGAQADAEAVALLCDLASGDGRAALQALDVALALVGDGGIVTAGDVARARAVAVPRHGRDEHYDMASALIKSVRGSDPDAGLYWLARMLEAGEDARFIARRLVILASEDVGLADPSALVVADAAARAVEFVGLPEAALNLAEAVVHLSVADKSNRVTVALGRAQADARQHPNAPVPAHLRDAHYRGASGIGHGEGYRYPHDDARGWVDQQYRPDEIEGRTYYTPGPHGAERAVAERMRRRRETDPKGRSEAPGSGPAGR